MLVGIQHPHSNSFIGTLQLIASSTIQDFTDASNGHVHDRVSPFTPQGFPVEILPEQSKIPFPLLLALPRIMAPMPNPPLPLPAPRSVHARLLPQPGRRQRRALPPLHDPASGVEHSDKRALIDHALGALEAQRQIAAVVRRKRNVDPQASDDQPRRHGQRPPAVGEVVHAELVQQRGRQVRPRQEHQEGGGAGQVQREAVVLVRGDLGRRRRRRRGVAVAGPRPSPR